MQYARCKMYYPQIKRGVQTRKVYINKHIH